MLRFGHVHICSARGVSGVLLIECCIWLLTPRANVNHWLQGSIVGELANMLIRIGRVLGPYDQHTDVRYHIRSDTQTVSFFALPITVSHNEQIRLTFTMANLVREVQCTFAHLRLEESEKMRGEDALFRTRPLPPFCHSCEGSGCWNTGYRHQRTVRRSHSGFGVTQIAKGNA